MTEKKQEIVGEEDFEPVEKVKIYGVANIVLILQESNDKRVHVKTSRPKNVRGNISLIRENGILEIRSFIKPQGSFRTIDIENSSGVQVSKGNGNVQIMNVTGKRQGGGKSTSVQISCDDEAGTIVIDGNIVKESLKPTIEITVPKRTELDFSSLVDGNISYK